MFAKVNKKIYINKFANMNSVFVYANTCLHLSKSSSLLL